jgi:DEAD/DEAH box helicase domain-containing protein
MGISCIVLYDSKADRFFEYTEDMVFDFIERLLKLDVVVGFNNNRFDNRVLSGHTDFDFKTIPTIDILEDIHKHLGYRLSLDNLAQITLGAKKSGDGLQALVWWKQGEIRKIMDYCRKDVEITRDLFLYGRKNRYLLFRNKAGNSVRVPVEW